MQTLLERDADLSVIVPVYNLERYISPLLDSLKKQDLKGYAVEYIFVMNNCTDKSEDVIRNSGLRCKIIYCEKQGCGCARNAGFEIAKGRYIWFLDGDDWLLSDTAISDVLDRAYAQDLDILFIPLTSNGFKVKYFSMVPQYLLKKQFVEEFRFPAIMPSEDDAYMLEVLKKVGKDRHSYLTLPSMEKPLYFYNYPREGSVMYNHYQGKL